MTTRFVVMLVMDSLFALMYYLWQWEGISQAGDVFMFMIWFCGIGGLLFLFAPAAAKRHRTELPVHRIMSTGFSIAFAVGTIWAGHIVAAAFYCVALILEHGYREKCGELAEDYTSSVKVGKAWRL